MTEIIHPLWKSLKRYNLPNHIHELTFSCHKMLPLLSSDRTCLTLAQSLIKACRKHDYGIVAYVFMPTHVHLLVIPNKKEYSVSEFVKSVKQPVASKEVSHLKCNEPEKLELLLSGWKTPKHLFWMHGGGYDRNIFDSSTLEKSMNYIHNNPVRKGLVEKATDWKWSSARNWILGDEDGEIPVVKGLLL